MGNTAGINSADQNEKRSTKYTPYVFVSVIIIFYLLSKKLFKVLASSVDKYINMTHHSYFNVKIIHFHYNY